MKYGISALLSAAIICSFPVAGLAHHKSKPKTKPGKTAIICPVTGTRIASTKAAVGSTKFKSKTYYFCCTMCKPRFDKAPAKFVANAKKGKFEKM